MQLSAGASIEVLDVSSADRRLQIDVSTTSPTVLRGKEIVLRLPEAYQGHLTYDARVKDASNAFSMQLTLNIYVLVNPCVHGRCEPRSDAGSCDHPQRSLTFDPYFCLCDPGYEGVWCQTETDECKTATCSPITDCVDLIDGYRCDPNPVKLVAIVLCSVTAVVLAVVGFWRLLKKSSKVGVM